MEGSDGTMITGLLFVLKLLFYCVYFGLFIDQMAESEQKQKYLEETGEKEQDKSESNDEESLSDHYLTEGFESQDFDLESTYLNRLRIQRKRIEDLSYSLGLSRDKYEEQMALRKSLEAQLEKYQNDKASSYRYEDITVQMESVQEENTQLKVEVQELKRSVFEATADYEAKLKKIAADNSNQRKKDLAKIETLQDQLAEKEDEVERLEKELKAKERQIQEINNQTAAKVNKVKEEYEEKVRTEQRRNQKLEKTSKSNPGQDFESQLAPALKELDRLKDENAQLKRFIDEREKELLYQIDKYKSKLSTLKKELKSKEKEYDDLKTSQSKFEREKREQVSEREELRVQITKASEEYQTALAKKDNDFYVQRRNMKATIDQQGKAIGQLMATRQRYLARIRQLQAIIKRKQNLAMERKSLLKEELREIDKLEKVIDRIVE